MAVAGCLAVLAVSGCKPSVAVADARDRATPGFARAISLEQVGKFDEAIKQYEQELLDHPRLFSAHLLLALLLHDHRQDYVAAVYHYQQYLKLRPGGEKDQMIEGRVRLAEQLLAAQLLRRVGDIADTAQARMSAEITSLNTRVTTLEGEKGALVDEKGKVSQELQAAQAEVQRLRRLVDNLRLSDADSMPERAKSSVLSRLLSRGDPVSEAEPEKLPPLSSDAIAAAREEAARLAAGGGTGAEARPTAGGQAAISAAASGTGQRAPALKTYVVQPGDTLFGIAERYYGDGTQWTKVREANKSRIHADGQVRAGQVLLIP